MNKYLLLVLTALLSFSSLSLFAQAPEVDSPEYNLQKANGTLQNYLPGNPAIITPGSPFGNPQISPLSGCDCYTEPDATWSTLQACDDCSSGNITIPFNFCLFGASYSSIYINNNGNISFGTPYGTFSPVVFPNANFIMVAPFWADVDTRNNLGQVRYKITPTALYVNWVNVGYYSMQGDKRNTFSVILTNNNDPVIGVGNNVAFCYKDMQWTTGSASSGQGGFGGTPALVGANWGNGVDFNMIGRFNSPGTTYFGPNANNNQVSWLDFKSFKFNVCNNVNVPPILINGNFPGYTFTPDTCNAINGGIMVPNGQGGGICVGQTVSGSFQFSGPENNQTVTVTAVGPPGLNAPTVSGPSPTFNVSYTPTMGTNGPQTITITATDNGNPNLSLTFSVVVNVTSPPYNPTISGDAFVCPGGTANLMVNEFFDTYTWSGAAAGSGQNISGPNGTYNVVVTLGACTLNTSYTVGLHQLPNPVIVGNTEVCAGSTTMLTTAIPYVGYNWSTADVTPTTMAGAGTHTVTVTDTNGCSNISAPFTIADYVQPQINTTPQDASCAGFADGTLTVTLVGGTGNESIVWDHDPAETSLTATGLAAGTYGFTITDANGCQWVSSGSVSEPMPLQYSVSTVNVTCPGGSDGSASVIGLTGGTTPYYYEWDGNPALNASTVAGLSMGNHTVIVTDAQGCILNDAFTLTEISVTPSISSTSQIESCPGASNGSIDLTVNGGTPGFTYAWNNGQTTEDAVDVPTGNYSVVVTDVNGCPYSFNTSVGVGENITLSTVVTDVLCHGDNTGSIVVVPQTGIAPFNVLMNGIPASLNNQNLQAGNYSFYITDVNGCYLSFSDVIAQPTPLVVDSTEHTIFLGDVINLDIFANGGVPPYTYQWIPASYLSCADCTSPIAWPVLNTSYTIVVTDANGCVSYGNADIEVIPAAAFAPTSFSPNGDGINDEFKVSIAGVKTFSIGIFSRWGEKVFETDDIYKGWDGKVNGKPAEPNVYVYRINVKYISGKDEEILGNVTIIR